MHLRRSVVVSPDDRSDGWARVGRRLSRHFHLPADATADLRLVRRSIEAHLAYLLAAADGRACRSVAAAGVRAVARPVVDRHLRTGCGCALGSRRRSAAGSQFDARDGSRATATISAINCRRTSMSSPCCSPATWATRARFARLLRRAMVVSSSNFAGESSSPRRPTAHSSRHSVNSATTSISSSCNRSQRPPHSAASAGAPVAKSLAAKCATLRGALSAEQEADARVRTGKITVPLVGMSVLIMAAVIYPALNFSR